MADPIEIDVWQGEIAELEVDAIVIPANESLFMTSSVARGVKLRGGDEVERQAIEQGPLAAGSAVVTGAGNLPTFHVIHAVAVGHELRADDAHLRDALRAALQIAERMGLHRIAIAAIGTERGVFTPDEAAAALRETIVERRVAGRWLPDSIVVVAGSGAELRAYRGAVNALRSAAQ